MAAAATDPADIISHLAWRPDDLEMAMIRITTQWKPPRVTHIDRPSSLGTLDRLPLEIQHLILESLDLQTVCRISRASVHGMVVVQSLPAYQELLQHAPYVADVLGQTKLLGHHPLIKFHGALRSKQCECCPEYGAFLFLPACVRCCWECLRSQPSLRVITPKQAKKYFGLNDQHLQHLLTLHTIIGRYTASRARDTGPSFRLVSAVAAQEQAILVYGSAEKLAHRVAGKLVDPEMIDISRFLQSACANPLREDSLARPSSQGHIPLYHFLGMAVIPFPWLQAPGSVENGLWCKGCQHTLELYRSDQLDLAFFSWILPTGLSYYRVLRGMARKAWSRADFLEHTRHCFGVQKLTRGSTCDDSL